MPLDLRSEAARTPTYKVAHCKVCITEWVVRSPSGADEKGCPFCDAPEDAITVTSEKPTGFSAETN